MKTPHDHHNDGEKDYAEGNGYNPPHGLLENALTWSKSGCDEIAEDNKAYQSGWDNAKSHDK